MPAAAVEGACTEAHECNTVANSPKMTANIAFTTACGALELSGFDTTVKTLEFTKTFSKNQHTNCKTCIA